MPGGVVVVHDAVDNGSTMKQLNPSIDFAKCSVCKLDKPKNDGAFSGKTKTVFRCKQCTNFEMRVRRMTHGTTAMQLWKDMSTEDKQAFKF